MSDAGTADLASSSGWPGAALLLDRDARLLAASDGLARLTGEPADRLVGRRFEELLAPASCALLQTHVVPVLLMRGAIDEVTLELRGAGARRLPVLAYGRVNNTAGSGDAPMQMLLVPVLARQRIDDELLRIKRAADESPGMLFNLEVEADGSRRLPYASSGVLALYGCTAHSARQDAAVVLQQIEPADAEQFAAHPPGLAEAHHRFVLRARRGDAAPAWHEVHAVSRRRSDGSVSWYGHVADVTDRQRLADELVQLRVSEQSQKSQYEFLGRVSHELRTPLNAVIGFAQLLRSPGIDAGSTARYARLVEEAGAGLLDLVNELLDISRLRSGQFEVEASAVSLRAVAARALERAALAARQRGVVLNLADGPSVSALADPRRLSQVLDNLLSNAIKYNRPLGSVDVAISLDGEDAVLAISDTGSGLDAAQVAQLFQPFNRLGAQAGNQPGSGLGLCIAKEIVQALRGRIEVDSAPGAGTCFRVRLPAAGTPPYADSVAEAIVAAAHAAEPAVPAAAARPRLRVLYVEDNAVNAILMCSVASRVPELELSVAENAAEALEAVRARRPDVLLIDRHLPDADGVELLARLRDLPGVRAIPAIMVSADARPDAVLVARAVGFDDFWPKPIDVPKVIAALRALIDASGAQPPSDSSTSTGA